jgi:archaemetzincin
MADRQRSIIYLQPLGSLNASETQIIDRAAKFLGIYYQLPVKVREPISLDVVPPSERRKRSGRAEQIRSLFVLDQVLVPRLPPDAAALIAFTTADLWPGEGWNRVYGQASLTDRVAVWSIHYFGDPSAGEDAFQQCLLRALKTGAHEMGHVFSANHCIFFECNMCGSNNLREADRRPLEPCPSCLAKLCYSTGADPVKRFEKLIEFYKAHGVNAEQDFCEKSLAVMKEGR